MLHTLLGLLHIVHLTIAYNLVIDTQVQGINEYLQSFQEEYEARLEDYSISKIRKKRCLGSMDLSGIIFKDVGVKSTSSIITDAKHYLRIEHLHASLHGSYKHNLWFIENQGDFHLDIRDLNATLGPLVPINFEGVPFLNEEIPCNVRHTKDKIKLTGGILHWLAKKRLKDIMKEDLEQIICDSLVEILDQIIRKSLKNFQFVKPITEEDVFEVLPASLLRSEVPEVPLSQKVKSLCKPVTSIKTEKHSNAVSISYHLVGRPLLMRHGAIRTFHAGITSSTHHGVEFIPSSVESQHAVIYHIHEALLSEAVQSVCNKRYMDFNLVTDEGAAEMVCQKATISVKNMEAMSTANLLLHILLRFHDGNVKMMEKNYTVSVLHSSDLEILFRIKSEIVSFDHRHLSYNDQIFSVVSEVMRSHVNVPLPIPAGAQADRSMIKLQPDRIIFATDFVFRGH